LGQFSVRPRLNQVPQKGRTKVKKAVAAEPVKIVQLCSLLCNILKHKMLLLNEFPFSTWNDLRQKKRPADGLLELKDPSSALKRSLA
jgi:hypothetical protein